MKLLQDIQEAVKICQLHSNWRKVMSDIWTWNVLINSLFDDDHKGRKMIKGPDLEEWLLWIQHDHDAVDSIYTDMEVLGG